MCRWPLLDRCVSHGVLGALILTWCGRLDAVPPVELEPVGDARYEAKWLNTGEDLRLESSADVGVSQGWVPLIGQADLREGEFRQVIDVSGLERGFYRLVENPADPTAPVFDPLASHHFVVFPGEQVTLDLSANDPNGLPVAYLAEPLPLPTGATFNMSTGVFSWVPKADQAGEYAFTFLATNGSSTGRVLVTYEVQEPPLGGATSLSGILLDTTDAVAGSDRPIVGAVVSLLGTGISDVTGADGRFLLDDVPSGLQVLDMATATAQPAPDGSHYAGFREAYRIVDGVANEVARPFYLPRIAMSSLKTVDPNLTTVVENSDLGITLFVPPHTALMGDDEFTGELSISLVPEALAPAALPETLGFGELITIQPVGVRFAQPVAITFRNNDDLPPGSEVDIWSLDPDAGIFTVVGTGRVTADGQFIETIEGGVRAADWHAPLPPGIGPGEGPGGTGPSSPGNSPGDGDGGDGDGGEGGPSDDSGGGGGGPPPDCPGGSNGGASGAFGSKVMLADGAVLTSIYTPAYISGGQDRALGLAYHSITACPRVILPILATIPTRSAVPNTVSLEGRLGGLVGGTPVHFDTSSLSESRDETFVAALSFDARQLETGFASYVVRATSHFRRSTVSDDTSARVAVVNRKASPFGAGWGIVGDQRVISASEDGSSQLIVSGDGTYKLFRDAATFARTTLASLGSDRVGAFSFAEGSNFSRARAVITEAFPNTVFNVGDELSQLQSADLLVLTPYASATQGAPLSASEQATLTAFVRGGGCALILLDHDLGRAGFAAALASLLEPFGLAGSNAVDPDGSIRPIIHPLVSGDYGVVNRLDMPFGGFEIGTDNTALDVIVSGDSTHSARLALLPQGALGDDSGPVIFISDTQAYMDVANIGLDGDPAHSALLLSIIDFCLRSQRDPTANVEFVGPPGDFSRLEKLPDGGFERQMPDGTLYEFDVNGRLVSEAARNGATSRFAYDAAGNLAAITDPFSKVIELIYDGGKLARVVDPAGRTTTYEHDAAGDLVRVQKPDGSAVLYEYDLNHLMTAEIDAESRRTDRVYDLFGRAVSANLPDGTQRLVNSVQGIASSLGGAAGTEGDPAPIKRPEDMVATFTNSAGELYQVEIGPVGTATSNTDSAGRQRSIQRNDDGQPLEVQHPGGRRYTLQYDRLGRPNSLSDAATGRTFITEYLGDLKVPISQTNGIGSTATFEYDAEMRRRAFTSFAGRRTSFTYDAAGSMLPSSRTSPSALVTNFEYDGMGNLRHVQAGEYTTTYAYSSAGDLTNMIDALGREYQFEYDAVGQLTRSTLFGGVVVEMGYDQEGVRNLLRTPLGAEHRMTHDARKRLATFVSPLGDDFRFVYEFANGRPTRLVWGDGTQVTYGYDDGRLTSLTTAQGTTSMTYGATTGLLNEVTAPGNDQLTYLYDTHGRLTSSEWTGVVNGKVARAYEALGRVASISVNDGAASPITYDADDLITRSGPMTINRDADSGNITSTTLGKCTDTWTHNPYGELVEYNCQFEGVTVYELILSRDFLGRVVSKEETVNGTTTVTEYHYGAAGRLVQEVRGALTIDYTYDANGNRLSRVERGGASEIGTYNAAEQVVSYAGSSYAYDACGRLSTRGNDTFVYDVLGDLKSANLDGGRAVTYHHPAGGRRISESADGVVQRQFLYQDALTIAAELDGTGALRCFFGYATLFGAPDFIQKGGETYRIFKDDLGSPRVIINCDTGDIAQIMRHDAFGRVLEDSAPRFQPFGFSGGLYDTDTGWLRFGVRDYDPLTGRWTAPDPSLFRGSVYNLYTYASNDPANVVDRNGLEDASASGCGGGGGGPTGGGPPGGGGGGGALPHACALKNAFGGDDLGGISAFSGPGADAAAADLGAAAFGQGGDVGFGDSSSIGLIAHEVSHVSHGEGGVQCSSVGGAPSPAEEMAARAIEQMVQNRGNAAGTSNNSASSAP